MKTKIVMKNWRLAVFALLGILSSCSSPDEQGLFIFTSTYDFSESQHGWEADFTDYPAILPNTGDSVYRWTFSYTDAPASAGGQKSIMLSCNNMSGDVFMFIKKKITGFQPNTTYTVVFEVDLASNAPSGASVILKAGATNIEPKKIIDNDTYSLNIDKGTTLAQGEDVTVLGDIGGSSSSLAFTEVVKSNASSGNPFVVRSNSAGEIWVVVGTDSGYRDITTVYYKKVSVVFSGSK